jgi:hypothetical protein
MFGKKREIGIDVVVAIGERREEKKILKKKQTSRKNW